MIEVLTAIVTYIGLILLMLMFVFAAVAVFFGLILLVRDISDEFGGEIYEKFKNRKRN